MARKRMLDPGVWEDEGFLELSLPAKLLFLGLISHADDEGRGLASPKSLKAKILPGENLSIDEIERLKGEIRAHLNVTFYSDSATGREYYALRRWGDYQYIQKKSGSKLPVPPEDGGNGGELPDRSVTNTVAVSPNRIERNRKEEKGIEENGGLPSPGEGKRAAAVPNPPVGEKKSETFTRPPSPFDEMIPLRRGALKHPPPCPRCKKPLSYFETRSGSRYAADRWYCDEKAEGCGGKFPEIEWEDPGEGKPLRRRSAASRSSSSRDNLPALEPLEIAERFRYPVEPKEAAGEG
jgi:hypothetical protein